MATAHDDDISDEELGQLAGKFREDNFVTLGKLLGFRQQYLRYVQDASEDGAILQLLKVWRNSQHERSDLREFLGDKLMELFQDQALFIKNSNITSKTNNTSIASPTTSCDDYQPVSSSGLQKSTPIVIVQQTFLNYDDGIPETTLSQLASDIRTAEDAEILARNLGCSEAEINRYMTTNRLTGRVTCKGTQSMLIDWRQKETPSMQARVLKDALLRSQMKLLADQYFGVASCLEVTDASDHDDLNASQITSCSSRITPIGDTAQSTHTTNVLEPTPLDDLCGPSPLHTGSDKSIQLHDDHNPNATNALSKPKPIEDVQQSFPNDDGISESTLLQLACDLLTDEDAAKLARNLGFSEAEINRYSATNRVTERVTCKGTQDMLLDWRQKEKPSKQLEVLRDALLQSELMFLADKYLGAASYHEDIYSMNITEGLTVLGCREKLIDHYKKDTCKIQLRPWDREDTTNVKDIFTVVSMVKKDREGNEIKRTVLEGSVNDIFSAKVDGMLPDRIILLATAGKGKTTAVAKLAYDWAHSVQGSPLKDLPLLFVLKLRKVDRTSTLGEAIISQLLRDEEGVIDPKELVNFIHENQKLCHIILDGLDEYDGSILEDLGYLVDVLKNKRLKKCRVLVTTRPHLEKDFNQDDLPRFYAKMEIIGFLPKDSRAYIDKFFNNGSEAKELKEYVEQNRVIGELVTIPLFCLMVCHLWKEKLLGGITTQMGLFDNVNLFLRRHLERRVGTPLPEEQFQKTIKELGKVALVGLLKEKHTLLFTCEDFVQAQSAREDGIKLGILSTTTTTSRYCTPDGQTEKTTTEFYHKLAQEHTAGKSLASSLTKPHLLRSAQVDNALKKVTKNVADYENLLRFAAGTTDAICVKVMELVLTAKRLPDSEKYRILLDCSSESTSLEGRTSDLVHSCISDGAVTLSSPTVYTAIGLGKLPDETKRQIKNMRISSPQLTPEIVHKLSMSVRECSQLRRFSVILDEGSPHESSLTLNKGLLKLSSVTPLLLSFLEGLNENTLDTVWQLEISESNPEFVCDELIETSMSGLQRCPKISEMSIRVAQDVDINGILRSIPFETTAEIRRLTLVIPSDTNPSTRSLVPSLGGFTHVDQLNISIVASSGGTFALSLHASCLNLGPVSDQLLSIIPGFNRNTLARISFLETSKHLPPSVVKKLAESMGMLFNLRGLSVTIKGESDVDSQLTLKDYELRIRPLTETSQIILGKLHENTLAKINRVHLSIPHLSVGTENKLKSSVGLCTSITALSMNAEGHDASRVLREINQATRNKIEGLHLSIPQMSATIARILASGIMTFPNLSDASILVNEGMENEAKLIMTDLSVAVNIASDQVLCMLAGFHRDVLAQINRLDVTLPHVTESLVHKLSNITRICRSLIDLNVHVFREADDGIFMSLHHKTLPGLLTITGFPAHHQQILPVVAGFHEITSAKVQHLQINSPSSTREVLEALDSSGISCPNLTSLAMIGATKEDDDLGTSTVQKKIETLLSKVQSAISHPTSAGERTGGESPDGASVGRQTRRERRQTSMHYENIIPHTSTLQLPAVAGMNSISATVRMWSCTREAILMLAEGSSDEAVQEGLDYIQLLQAHHIQIKAPKSPLSFWRILALKLEMLSEVNNFWMVYDEGTPQEANLVVHRGHLWLTNVIKDVLDVLESLHPKTQKQIHSLKISESDLSNDLSIRLGSILDRFPCLSDLSIEKSSINFSTRKPLPSVRSLHTRHAPSDRFLLITLPELTELEVLFVNAEDDLLQILAGIDVVGTPLISLALSGKFAGRRNLSSSCVEHLCYTLKKRTKKLEELSLLCLEIDAVSLVALIDSCRTLTTMREISIWQCGASGFEQLNSFLTSVRVRPTGFGIIVDIENESPSLSAHHKISYV